MILIPFGEIGRAVLALNNVMSDFVQIFSLFKLAFYDSIN